MKNGASMQLDRLAEVARNIRTLAEQQVLVGVPQTKTERNGEERLTNAEIAYIQSKGAPEINLPARPFIQPGIEKKKTEIADELRSTADAALDGRPGSTEIGLKRAGQIGATAAQTEIREGLQPPLKPSTIANRRRRSAGSKYRRKAKSEDQVKPLWDTGQLLRSITYVIRKR